MIALNRRVLSRLAGAPAWRQARSLRFRLALWLTGSVFLALAAASLLAYAEAQRALILDTDAYLAIAAHRIVDATRQPGFAVSPQSMTGTVVSLSRLLNARAINPLNLPARLKDPFGPAPLTPPYMCVLDEQQNVLAVSPGPAPPGMANGLRVALRQMDSTLHYQFVFAALSPSRTCRIVSKRFPTGPRLLIVQMALPWSRSEAILARLRAYLLLGLPTVLLAVAVGAWVLVGRSLRPIDRIVAEVRQRTREVAPETRTQDGPLPSLSLTPPPETDAEIARLIETFNGLTVRLVHALDAAQKLTDAQQRFAADATHELQTPLAIAQVQIELALKRPRPPEAYQATLASVLEEIHRLSRIATDLGILARQDAASVSAQAVYPPVDLASLAREVARDFGPQAEAKSVALRAPEADAAPLYVRADRAQMEHLLRNLIDNALKYTPVGGHVEVIADTEGGEQIVRVSDSGMGIAPADLPRVFDRFWRAGSARAMPGSGLGLAICQEIARAHGGRLLASSELGRGSRFTLRLPK